MKEWWQRKCYFMSIRLLQWSGSSGAKSWQAAEEMKEFARKQWHHEETLRYDAEGKLRGLIDCCQRVDGLLSGGMKEVAQAQLRVGLLNAR